MKRLNSDGILEFQAYLKGSGLDRNLQAEILDHLACEAEERMWEGQSMAEALKSIKSEVDKETLSQLHLEHKHLLAMDESLTEIVFENRNRQYGAYVLRREYSANVLRATLLGVTLFLLIFIVPSLYARLNPEPDPDQIMFEATLQDFVMAKEKVIPREIEKQSVPVAKSTVKNLPPEVVQDPKVLEETPPPTVDRFDDAESGPKTVAGTSDGVVVLNPPMELPGTSKANVIELEDNDADKVHLFVEQQPAFQGGVEALSAFLSKNLKYPRRAASANVEGRVFAEFTVGSDGSVENIRVVKGIGFGCDEEAVRVIGLMPRWLPGKQSGRPVRVKFTLPITFQLE